jgi:hypothetical protein
VIAPRSERTDPEAIRDDKVDTKNTARSYVGDAKMMNTESQQSHLPNGPAAAAMLACGVGVCTTGVLVVLGEASSNLAGALNFIDSVGPLSGKVAVAIVVWLVSWAILHKLWGRSQVGFRKITWVAFALIIAGFALTFPPIFQLFGA